MLMKIWNQTRFAGYLDKYPKLYERGSAESLTFTINDLTYCQVFHVNQHQSKPCHAQTKDQTHLLQVASSAILFTQQRDVC